MNKAHVGFASEFVVTGGIAYVADGLSNELRLINVSSCFVGGACCVSNRCFEGKTEAACVAFGGVYLGDESVCAGTSCTAPCLADFDQDNEVDFDDLAMFLGAWGPCF